MKLFQNKNCKKKINRLIGYTKKEILQNFGGYNNKYCENEWVIILKKNWLGRKTVLFVDFDENDKVIGQYIISTYKTV